MPIVPREIVPGTTGNSSAALLLLFLMQLAVLRAADRVVPALITGLRLRSALDFDFRFRCFLLGLRHRDHPLPQSVVIPQLEVLVEKCARVGLTCQ